MRVGAMAFALIFIFIIGIVGEVKATGWRIKTAHESSSPYISAAVKIRNYTTEKETGVALHDGRRDPFVKGLGGLEIAYMVHTTTERRAERLSNGGDCLQTKYILRRIKDDHAHSPLNPGCVGLAFVNNRKLNGNLLIGNHLSQVDISYDQSRSVSGNEFLLSQFSGCFCGCRGIPGFSDIFAHLRDLFVCNYSLQFQRFLEFGKFVFGRLPESVGGPPEGSGESGNQKSGQKSEWPFILVSGFSGAGEMQPESGGGSDNFDADSYGTFFIKLPVYAVLLLGVLAILKRF